MTADEAQYYIGTFILAGLLSVAGTWVISMVAVHIYRRRVQREMSRARHDAPEQALPPLPELRSVDAPPITMSWLAPTESDALLRAARRSARRAQLIFGVAGLIYASTAGCVLLALGGAGFTAELVTVVTLMYAWPIVPTVLAQMPAVTSVRVAAVWAVYLVVVVALPFLGGLTLRETAFLTSYSVLAPAVFVAATSARTVRGAAWLVAPALFLSCMAGLLVVTVLR